MHSIAKRTAVLSAATAAVALIGAGCSHTTKAGQTASSAPSSVTSAIATGPSATAATSTQIAGANGTEYTVEGPILAKYQSLDAATRKALGAPTGNEDKHADGGGIQVFDGGAICVHGSGAYVVLGKIRDKWNALGGMDGKLGFPTGDQDTHPDGGGFQEFDGGAICDHGAGTYVVWGKIRDKWNELGGMDGKLGLPTSDETDTPDGAKTATFEHGTITWKPGDAQATVVYS
jgi:uncharacterized protein with LGFP repeats